MSQVSGPSGKKGSEPGSSLVPVPVVFVSSRGSGLVHTSAQIGQAFDLLSSLSLAAVTC